MNTKHKTQQWAPTELPRMRRELVLAAEEAADRAVNDPKVATRLQADEEKLLITSRRPIPPWRSDCDPTLS